MRTRGRHSYALEQRTQIHFCTPSTPNSCYAMLYALGTKRPAYAIHMHTPTSAIPHRTGKVPRDNIILPASSSSLCAVCGWLVASWVGNDDDAKGRHASCCCCCCCCRVRRNSYATTRHHQSTISPKNPHRCARVAELCACSVILVLPGNRACIVRVKLCKIVYINYALRGWCGVVCASATEAPRLSKTLAHKVMDRVLRRWMR